MNFTYTVEICRQKLFNFRPFTRRACYDCGVHWPLNWAKNVQSYLHQQPIRNVEKGEVAKLYMRTFQLYLFTNRGRVSRSKLSQGRTIIDNYMRPIAFWWTFFDSTCNFSSTIIPLYVYHDFTNKFKIK